MDIEAWARKNKKPIAREFIRKSGFKASEEPVGIFTAGLPGAGKTEFTVELLKDIIDHTLRIDMDEIAQQIEGYKPGLADKFRAGASIILERIYDEVIKSHFDFVMDGTFSHPKAVSNIERALHKGYKIKLYYIHQEPQIAWQFTKDREAIEHRAITREGFINTYKNIALNLGNLQGSKLDVTISVVIKDSRNRVGRIIENVKDLSREVPEYLTETELEAAII